MPSTRKQKAKEKRSRQSDVMSDIENLDVMLGAYSRNDLVEDENNTEPEVDLESGRHQRSEGQTENNFRSLLNTNPSENSEVTVETNRLINSEISSQMSRKLEELKTDLNSHILDVINSALEERVLPSIKNALETKNSAKNVNLDLRSDGLHSNDFSQEQAQRDLRSYGRHLENPTQRFQDAQNDFPRLESMRNNRTNHCRRNSIDSNNSNENDDGYDSRKLKLPALPAIDRQAIAACCSARPSPFRLVEDKVFQWAYPCSVKDRNKLSTRIFELARDVGLKVPRKYLSIPLDGWKRPINDQCHMSYILSDRNKLFSWESVVVTD